MKQRVIKQLSVCGNEGQALVLVLVFMLIGITITSGTIVLSVVNARSASKLELGQQALSIAHSGGENAMMRLLRDPTYTGETLSVGNGTATITVSGSPKKIVSVGKIGNFSRTVEVIATGSGFLTVSTWKETP